MNVYTVKVKEESGDIYRHNQVTHVGFDYETGVLNLENEDGRTTTYLLDYVDEITITKNL